MKKHIILIATLTALCAVCFADITQPAELQANLSEAKEAGNTPHLVKKVRSPLGKEIDRLGKNLTVSQIQAWNRDAQMFNYITNLAARVEKLEAVEAERKAFREAAKKRAGELKAKREEKTTARVTLQNVIKRGKKAANKEVK